MATLDSVNTAMQFGDKMFEKVGIVHISWCFLIDFRNTFLDLYMYVWVCTETSMGYYSIFTLGRWCMKLINQSLLWKNTTARVRCNVLCCWEKLDLEKGSTWVKWHWEPGNLRFLATSDSQTWDFLSELMYIGTLGTLRFYPKWLLTWGSLNSLKLWHWDKLEFFKLWHWDKPFF